MGVQQCKIAMWKNIRKSNLVKYKHLIKCQSMKHYTILYVVEIQTLKLKLIFFTINTKFIRMQCGILELHSTS